MGAKTPIPTGKAAKLPDLPGMELGAADPAASGPPPVSRSRYDRAIRARKEAEALLEEKSRALWAANEALRHQAEHLESEVARRTEELEAAKVQAEAASAAKSSFLAMISHEIRTPMNAVLGMATGLKESGLTPEQAEMAETVLASGRSLLSLLNDLLDLSKIEAGQMEIELRRFDLRQMCSELRALFSEVAASRGLWFELAVDAPEGEMLVTDPTRLRQVVSNLLSNAMKFTDEGGVKVSVAVQGAQLTVTVQDTGRGVPEAQQDRLFRAFVQADSSITRTHGGTGLGLAISRRLCRLLGGDLVYEDAPGGGALFRAHVELKDAPHGDRRRDRMQEFEAAAVLCCRPWRVLVAEDSLTNQKVLQLVLRPFELELEMVGDGAKAVARQLEQPFDMILMDVNMPVMDGLTAAAEIRTWEAAQGLDRVPIIALTANAMTHQVADYLQKGIDAHVGKPVRREVLALEMARLLARANDGECL